MSVLMKRSSNRLQAQKEKYSTLPVENRPYHAANKTAGKTVMKGTAFSPINGVRAARSSTATIVATTAAP